MMAQRIKEKRLELGLTQEELAEKLGLQKSAVCKYEAGRVTNIKRATIQKMATLFDCSPSWLLGLKDEEHIDTAMTAAEDAAFFAKYQALPPEKKAIINQLVDQLSE